MKEKEVALLIKEHVINTKKEIGEQYVASYYKVFREPITNVKDIELLFVEAEKIGITMQYAEQSPFKRDFKNDNFQTIIAYIK